MFTCRAISVSRLAISFAPNFRHPFHFSAGRYFASVRYSAAISSAR